MADKFINETGVVAIRDWANSKYATKRALQTLQDEVDQIAADGGKIQKVKVNGTEQTIDTSDKSVNIAVPTAVSDLTNDSGYQTASDVQSAISTAVASAYKYKGSVATYANLPSSGNTIGDVWDVQDTGVNYAWTGTNWDALGFYVDASILWSSQTGQSNSLNAMTVAEINAILEPST